jgi:gamma-glutamyl:cysteine ligase YbdK (ATP-grasp superfamily)
MIEFVSDPGDTFEVVTQTLDNLKFITHLCEEMGLRFLPTESYFGQFENKMRDYKRYSTKKKLIGEKKFELCGQICGQHIHFSLNENEDIRVKQINFLTFVDPAAIALSANSPSREMSSWRTYTYRKRVHENLYFQGELQPFKRQFRDYISQLHNEFRRFEDLAKEWGVPNLEGMDSYTGVWGPIRINDKYKTVEISSIGASPAISINLAMIALLKGGMNLMEDVSRDLENDPFICFSEKQFVSLRTLSDKAIVHGLKDDEVYAFTKRLVEFCKKGLSAEEQRLLKPLEILIERKENISTEVKNEIGDFHIRDHRTETAKAIHERLYQLFLIDLDISTARIHKARRLTENEHINVSQ